MEIEREGEYFKFQVEKLMENRTHINNRSVNNVNWNISVTDVTDVKNGFC